MSTFSEHLRALPSDRLVDLLLHRPDLAHPSPATLGSLAARATSRPSLDRALSTVDAGVLQALESVAVLQADRDAEAGDGARGTTGVRSRDVVAAVGAGRDGAPRVRARLRAATDLALLYPVGGLRTDPALRTAPGLVELLGPYPAGLAPRDGVPIAVPVLGDLTAAAQGVLGALTWGPPVGVRPATGPGATVVDDLLRRGLLVPADRRAVAGRTEHVLLPRDVALALRHGRTHPSPADPPDLSDLPVRGPELLAAESATAADRLVRLVATLTDRWSAAPPAVLRTGGVGVRDLRRTAQVLEVTEPEAAFVIEVASAAGLLRDDGQEHPVFLPTTTVDEWAAGDLPARWARLVRAWATTTRWPALAGGRDDRGQVRAPLGPHLTRPWSPRLRTAVLDVLAALPAGAAPGPDQVRTALSWRTPRAVASPDAVAAVLRESAWLGLLGAGALATAGRALVGGSSTGAVGPATDENDGAPGAPGAGGARVDPVATALADNLPPAVDDLMLQGDLTGVVPGRPSPDLDRLLDSVAQVESRSGAVTVRFTPESVRGALDRGATADQLIALLARHSSGPVPQPLEYLVRDAARRHGRLRAGTAASYVRTDDPALLAGVAEDPALAPLGLVRLAPTVLAAQVPLVDLLAALRERGLSPAAEAPDGRLVRTAPALRRVPEGRRRRPDQPVVTSDPVARATALAATLRRVEGAGSLPSGVGGLGPGDQVPDDAPAPRDRPDGAGTADPGEALGVLREAAAERAEVWLEMVGPRGTVERRRVRPLRVDGGRVRVVDTDRDAEIVVAAHRVASVTRT